jgi:ABC-type spermidine/putrescine transport system permease subunit I
LKDVVFLEVLEMSIPKRIVLILYFVFGSGAWLTHLAVFGAFDSLQEKEWFPVFARALLVAVLVAALLAIPVAILTKKEKPILRAIYVAYGVLPLLTWMI